MNHSIVAFEDSYHGDNDSPFDQIKHTDNDGEHWRGRELMPLMEYPRWQDFTPAIDRARAAARNQGLDPDEVFRTVPENPSKQGGRPGMDVRMTRFGAYLVAMNGDPRKKAVAAAQAYFAVKTREAEARTELSEIEVARKYVAALEAKQELQAQVAVLEPKAAIADQFLGSADTIYLNDLAKNLKLTRHRLITVLRDEGVLYADELQYRKGFEDWFRVEWDWVPALGENKKALKVTKTGVQAIYELLVDGEWISPDRRRPTNGPVDNRP